MSAIYFGDADRSDRSARPTHASARMGLFWSIVVLICAANVALAASVTIVERSIELSINLPETDRASALYDALDVSPILIPGQCYSEDICIPDIFRKTVSSGDAQLRCDTCRVRPCGGWEYCMIKGRFGPPPLGFSFIGDAAAIIARALDQVGNPFISADGLASLACGESTCTASGTISEYWLDHNNFFYALHEYGSYGRAVLRPFFVNEDGQRFYDIFAVPEEIRPGDIAIKRLRAGDFDITCYRAIASFYLYRYRCNWDVPYSGTLPYPVDVTSTLVDDAAATLYRSLDLPETIREFQTSDGLYSVTCSEAQCDIRIRRPIPN